ncbi:phage holin family protein [Nocardioides sp. W7]|uniref:phage holin family protein n=1 Tax=Nocardioides sp. W7 TaxID=2931390 RepID=UPI001FD0CEF7|nr:phage holin family protein [Nocardioides sp. W7]
MTEPRSGPLGEPLGDPLGEPGLRPDERSLGEIVGDVATDLSTLIKQEMDLAKVELKEEVAKAGKGAGLLGGAGLSAYMVLLFLSLTIVFALDEALPLWAAALIVTALWGIAAAVLAMTGRTALKKSNPQLPKTQQTLKEDAAWAKAQKS